jgi:hypothetical protein
MLPSLGTTDRASISDVTGLDGAAVAERQGRVGGESCCSSREGQRRPKGGAAQFVHGFFSVCGGRSRSLTYLLRKIQYFYTVLAYGASTPPLIYPLASH